MNQIKAQIITIKARTEAIKQIRRDIQELWND